MPSRAALEKLEWLIFSPPARGQRGFRLQEEGNIRAEDRGEILSLSADSGCPNNSFKPSRLWPRCCSRPPSLRPGDSFSRRMRTPSLIRAAQSNATAARCTRLPRPPGDQDSCRSVQCWRARASKTKSGRKSGSLHHCLQFVKAVAPLAEDVQQQVDLAGRFFSSVTGTKKRQHRDVGALGRFWNRLVVEDAEAAAGYHRRHVASR